MKRFTAIVGAVVLSSAMIVGAAQTADAATASPQWSVFDKVFYNGGTQTIYAVATSGRGVFVPPGHKSSEYTQSIGNVPGDTYNGTYPACYHYWKSGGDEGSGGFNKYGRSFVPSPGGPNDPTYVTAYDKKTCP